LLLDVMGTIVREPFLEDVPRFFGMTLAELMPLLSRETWFEFERGEIDEAAFARRFFLDGRPFDCEGLKAVLSHGFQYLPGMRELLEELHATSVEMHVLSNYPVWYRLVEEELRLSRYVSWTFVSCKTGVRKPDAEAYTGAARALGVAPKDCLFVDDRSINCTAAVNQGMTAVHFATAVELRRALENRGVLDR